MLTISFLLETLARNAGLNIQFQPHHISLRSRSQGDSEEPGADPARLGWGLRAHNSSDHVIRDEVGRIEV